MKKSTVLFCFLLVSISMVAQKSIHQYKYIIVSEKFASFNSADKYKTSSLSKFLFNKYGYQAYLNTDKFPDDFNSNRCLALFVDLKDSSGMIRTKVNFVFKDCNNNLIYTSKVGSSKSKDFKIAYQEAIRAAFNHVRGLSYKYSPLISTQKKEVLITEKQKAINKVVKQLQKKVTKEKLKAPVVVHKPQVKKAKQNSPSAQKVNSVVKKIISPSNVLQAKANLLGYQLLDNTSNVVFTILKTNVTGVYVIKGNNGILYQKNGVWIAEFYQDDKRILQEYHVKF